MAFTHNKYVKSVCFGLIFSAVCYIAHVNESEISKAKRVNFPGITFVQLNKTIKNLNLEKDENEPHPDLISTLNSQQLKIVSAIYNDKKNNLTVVITQSHHDNNFIFVVLRNNQLVQLQKITTITNQSISLQYGKVVLNTKTQTANSDTLDVL